MQVEFNNSFIKDLAKLKDKELAPKAKAYIEIFKNAKNINDVRGLVKITGYEHFYRIRIGNYRLGLFIKGDIARFVTIMHRKDIYRSFPE